MDLIKNREIDLIINTSTGHRPKRDQVSIRAVAVAHNVPLITTISGAAASVHGHRSPSAGRDSGEIAAGISCK